MRTRRIAVTIAAIAVVLIGVAIAFRWALEARHSVQERAVADLHDVLGLITEDVHEFNRSLVDRTTTLAASPALTEALRSGVTGAELLTVLRQLAGPDEGIAFISDAPTLAWPRSIATLVESFVADADGTAPSVVRGDLLVGAGLPIGTDGYAHFLGRAPVIVDGRVLGTLVLMTDDQAFPRLFERYHLAESVDVFAVDAEGIPLSPTRFPLPDGEMPTGVLTNPRTGEPTLAVTEVTAGNHGSSSTPYEDYRGVAVVGTWEWHPELELGLVVEMDEDQAVGGAAALFGASRVAFVLLGGLVAFELASAYRRRVALETEVRRTTLELEAVIDALPDSLVVTDADGTVLRAYPGEAIEEAGLASPTEGEPFPWPADPPTAVPGSSGMLTLRRWAQRGESGVHHFETRTVPIPELGRMLSVVQDVTATVEQEQALIEASAEKDAFLATVSHEIRTPLTTILGLLELLAETGRLSESEAQELLALATGEAEYLAELVDDLIVMRRAVIGELSIRREPTALTPLVHDTVRAMERRLERPIGVSVSSDVEILGDPTRVRQILRNLLSNAHIHGGASVTVSVAVKAGAGHLIVTDDGPGVPLALQASMFERYVSGTKSSSRTDSLGIGLALSRELARRMGGDLTYGRGATATIFDLELPLAPTVGTGASVEESPATRA